MEIRTWKASNRTWGDAAVDGLLYGVAAGLVMALFLVCAGLLRGQSWVAMLGQFDPGLGARPMIGLLTHLAVASVYGAVFGVLWRVGARLLRSLPVWAAGLLFGLAMWLVAVLVASTRGPAAGGWLSGIPPLEFALAHGVYGLALGWLSTRIHTSG
ncbi:MAG: hypothetical protein ABI847_17055 [Anaerolineales bacterium]